MRSTTGLDRLAACGLLYLTCGLAPLHGITVLLVGGAPAPTSGADGAVFSFLEVRYGTGNVFYLAANAAGAGDEAGYDVLLISSTVGSSQVRGKFHDSATPVVNWESVITANSAAGEFEVTTDLDEAETDHTIRVTASHPITSGFAAGQLVQLVNGANSVFWSVPPESPHVTHLAEDDDTPSNKFLSILEQGETLMGGGTAAARRVIFGLKNDTFNAFTEDGKTLFGQAVDWAAAGSVTPGAPTVTNTPATDIAATSATMGGVVTVTGGISPTVTLYWGDNDGGTGSANWDAAIQFGVQGGAFSGSVTGLAPGTTYYFRSFASNAGGADWADTSASFTTAPPPDPPVVANGAATAIGFTQADVNGEVLSTGGEAPNVTIYFGDHDGGTVPGNWDDAVGLGEHAGAFSNSLFALNPGTAYYFRAFAENSGGQAWAASTGSFTTLAYSPPTIENEPAAGISGTAAQVGGTVTATGGEAPSVTVFWGDHDGGTDPASWDHALDLGERSAGFTAVLSGLTPLATYYYRAYAQNGGGGAWAASTASFTTLDASEVVINEFMAANDGGASNNPNGWWPIANQVPGTTDDWIEILNTGSTVMSLAGWHLTDDPADPAKWTFPPGTGLAAGEFLVVYASGNNAPDANGNLHANFSLAAGGERLALVRPSGTVASQFDPDASDYPPQDDDVSYGLHPASGEPVYFSRPTPGAPNDAGGLARVADTKFEPDRGYYQSAIAVTVTTETAGAVIYYTTDGTPPITASGAPTARARAYTGPIQISRTTPVRAAAALPGRAPSNIDTHTYVLLDIDNASPNGTDTAGLNSPFILQRDPRWGALASGDYNMDPVITRSTSPSTGHPGHSVAQAMLKGMRDIPTIALALDPADFAGGNGIYSNPGGRGFAWERECAAEFLPALLDSREDWGENCGLRVQGGASREPGKSPKHSLSLRFRAEYGVGKLRRDLFPDGPVREFNVVSLRAGYNNAWIHSDAGQRDRGSMIRDQWARESLLEMGHADAGRGFMVHLLVNGLYWGVHNLCERPDAAHYAAYHGGDEERLDAWNGADLIDGNTTAWNAMKSVVSARNWENIQRVLDIDNYIDYQIVNRYGANHDLKTNGNWRAVGGGPYSGGDPTGMAPWRLYSWDGERILESPTATNEPLDPMGIRVTLDSIPEYRLRFADRLQKHFFNDGTMTPEACRARWMKFANSLDRAIIAESARWGDHRRTPAYTRDAEWLAEQNRLSNTYFPVRSSNVLSRYRSQGFYPSIDAPAFRVDGTAQHGGEIPAGATLTLTAASGTIYYTLDGSDPRLSGGAVNPNAIAVNSGQSVTLPGSMQVRMRARSGATWSALEEASFYLEPLASPEDLLVSEVQYHPAAASALEKAAAAALPQPRALDNADLFEFIEICNLAAHPVNMDGVRFVAGIDFSFGNAVLAPGEYAVVAKDAEAFAIRYPGVPVAGVFAGNLANDGERVALVTADGETVCDFVYDDSGGWPARADGGGSSIEVDDMAGDYSLAAAWRASSEYHGSPGRAGEGPDGRIVINEVLTHTDSPLADAIELLNTTGLPVDVSGWVLSDSAAQLRSFAIPPGTTIGSGGYLVFDESDFNAGTPSAITAFGGTVAAAPTFVASAGHGLSTGDVVMVAGYGGLGAYNGTFEVTVIDGGTFAIEAVYFDNAAAKGSWQRGRPFALDGAHGEEVWLIETDSSGRPVRFVDHVTFDAAFEGESLGRWPNGAGSAMLTTMTATTFGEPNAGPQVGPVVISEVMYQPAGSFESQLEFVEICNAGGVVENLANWKLRGGADFDFGATHSLAPGEVLVIVAFDPLVDAAAASAFRAAYGIDGSVPLVGPFTDGPLRDDTGALRIQRPDAPPPAEPGYYPAVTEDGVVYESSAPWPAGAAGGGESLQRADLAGFGSFASSWTASTPNPGGKALAYSAWRDAFFGPGTPPDSGPFDDFDLDGAVNLLEFALRLNPLAFDSDLLPGVEVSGGELSLTFVKDTLLAGVACRVEVSADLVNWEAAPDVVVSASGFVETRRASVTMAPHQAQFLRLVVEEQ